MAKYNVILRKKVILKTNSYNHAVVMMEQHDKSYIQYGPEAVYEFNNLVYTRGFNYGQRS